MKRTLSVGAAVLAIGLGGCVAYRQESVALHMPRPGGAPSQLAAFAAPAKDYPSVGGDILKDAAPTASAAYDASLPNP
jgi:hypothetical protein